MAPDERRAAALGASIRLYAVQLAEPPTPKDVLDTATIFETYIRTGRGPQARR